MERPKLSDPQEFAIIKSIYFKEDGVKFNENIDPIERLSRQESRYKNLNKSSR